jgi:hypothetical protein
VKEVDNVRKREKIPEESGKICEQFYSVIKGISMLLLRKQITVLVVKNNEILFWIVSTLLNKNKT